MTSPAAHGSPLALVTPVCDLARTVAAGSPLESAVETITDRLSGPLRVAIAGRVKAGKSTLLNALVGERLAPTDAGECTRIVTCYQDGLTYDVRAVDRVGATHPLVYRRSDGVLEIDLDGREPADIERIDVVWPSQSLRTVTLIDTPGLASLNDENSLRTRDLLALDDDRVSGADAVIYLMRHLHRRDAEFLDAFLDRSVAATSPTNAVAVLSRADEIGGCRLDALESAERIAARYRQDPDLRTLCTTVVPVAGLLAETGQTLREDEAAVLRTLANLPTERLEPLLWSTDGFCAPGLDGIGVESRRSLLLRLGMFGLRLSIGELRAGRVSTAAELSRILIEASGIGQLRTVLDELFLPRAQVLKARSALAGLRALAGGLASRDPEAARRLSVEVERVEAMSLDVAQLRLLHLVRSGFVSFTAEESDEVDLVTGLGTVPVRLRLDPGADAERCREAAVEGVERWRTRAADPLADPMQTEAAEAMARSYEALYAEVAPQV